MRVDRFLFFILLLLLLPSATAIATSKRVALVIGNGAYKSSPLQNPVNDARDMTSMLEKLGFEVISRTNVDKRHMVSAINRFAETLQHSEIGLFYYAGHGMQINNRNFLIPVSVNVKSESDVEFEAVDAGRVIGKMRQAGNKLNVVILDACRNNPFKRSFRTSSQGLARMDAPIGTIIAYATSPGSIAADGSGRNGIYTKYLLHALNTPGLNIQDIFNEAGMKVMEETHRQQVPWTSNTPIPRYYLAGGPPDNEKNGGSNGYVPGPETGTLKVTSNPSGADVLLNGKDAGRTPVQLSGMKPGVVDVSVTKSGFKEEKRQPTILSGRRVVVSIDLHKEQTIGWLTVRSDPADARVRLLNIKERYSPGMKLAAGRYHLEVSSQGCETQKRWVEVVAGDDIHVNVTLKRKKKTADPSTGMRPDNEDAAHQNQNEALVACELINISPMPGGSRILTTTESECRKKGKILWLLNQLPENISSDEYVKCKVPGSQSPVTMKAGACVRSRGIIIH